MTTRNFEKAIRYEPISRDFACYLDGDLICYTRSYQAGEKALAELVLSILAHQQTDSDAAWAAMEQSGAETAAKAVA